MNSASTNADYTMNHWNPPYVNTMSTQLNRNHPPTTNDQGASLMSILSPSIHQALHSSTSSVTSSKDSSLSSSSNSSNVSSIVSPPSSKTRKSPLQLDFDSASMRSGTSNENGIMITESVNNKLNLQNNGNYTNGHHHYKSNGKILPPQSRSLVWTDEDLSGKLNKV